MPNDTLNKCIPYVLTQGIRKSPRFHQQSLVSWIKTRHIFLKPGVVRGRVLPYGFIASMSIAAGYSGKIAILSHLRWSDIKIFRGRRDRFRVLWTLEGLQWNRRELETPNPNQSVLIESTDRLINLLLVQLYYAYWISLKQFRTPVIWNIELIIHSSFIQFILSFGIHSWWLKFAHFAEFNYNIARNNCGSCYNHNTLYGRLTYYYELCQFYRKYRYNRIQLSHVHAFWMMFPFVSL